MTTAHAEGYLMSTREWAGVEKIRGVRGYVGGWRARRRKARAIQWIRIADDSAWRGIFPWVGTE